MTSLMRLCFIIVGFVLWPLGAMASAVPMPLATVQVAAPTATTQLARADAVGCEAERPGINDYDAALFAYEYPSGPRIASGDGAISPYDGYLERAHRREVNGDGPIYDAHRSHDCAGRLGGIASDAKLFRAYRADLAQQEIQSAAAIASALRCDPYSLSASFRCSHSRTGRPLPGQLLESVETA